MKRVLLLALATFPLIACGGAVDESEEVSSSAADLSLSATDWLIDFDQVLPVPGWPGFGSATAIPANSIIDNSYAGYGVTFSCVQCTSGHVYARPSSAGSNGASLIDPNASVFGFFDARFGAVRAEFTTPRSWVSIEARPILPAEFVGTPINMPWIEAYDANGTFLSKTLYPIAYGQPGWGTAQTLTINVGSAVIKAVRFSSRAIVGTPPVYGEFDNLRFNGDPIVLTPVEKPPIVRPIKLTPAP